LDSIPALVRAATRLLIFGVHEALCCGLPAIVSASAGVAERYPADRLGLLLANSDDAMT